jgi:hypothetical protein
MGDVNEAALAVVYRLRVENLMAQLSQPRQSVRLVLDQFMQLFIDYLDERVPEDFKGASS